MLNSKHVWLESKLIYGLVYYLLYPLRPLWDIRSPFIPILCDMWCLTPSEFYLTEVRQVSLAPSGFRSTRFPFVAWRHRKATLGIRDCFILSSWPSHQIRLRFLSMITLWPPVFLLSSLFAILLGQKMGQIFPSTLSLLIRLPRYVKSLTNPT